MMEEQKKKLTTWMVVGEAIVIVVLAIILLLNNARKGEAAPAESTTAPAVASPTGNRFSVVDLKAQNGKFVPDTFSVPIGKVLMINFTAVDGAYDFGFVDPKLGFDVMVRKGETQSFGLDTTGKTAGSYAFHCIQYCPKDGTMTGTMTLQ